MKSTLSVLINYELNLFQPLVVEINLTKSIDIYLNFVSQRKDKNMNYSHIVRQTIESTFIHQIHEERNIS